jgi:hypothetical protein
MQVCNLNHAYEVHEVFQNVFPVLRRIIATPKSDQGDQEMDCADNPPVVCTELISCHSTPIRRDICNLRWELSQGHVCPDHFHNILSQNSTSGGRGLFLREILFNRDVCLNLIKDKMHYPHLLYYIHTQAAAAEYNCCFVRSPLSCFWDIWQ